MPLISVCAKDEDELQRPITSETFRPTGSEARGDHLVLDFDAWADSSASNS
jgi:hypothetical protein